MVSFTCNYCQDVVKKPKVVSHSNSCGSNSFCCVDCMQVFDLHTIKAHTSCVSEVQKYQGQWKQKCTSNGNPKKASAADSDSDNDATSAKPAPMRPPRPTMTDLSDSDSDDDWVSAKRKAATPNTAMKRSRPSAFHVDAAQPPTKRTRDATPTGEVPAKALSQSTPLMLPSSTASDDCMVPSFVLGSSTEVAEIVEDILSERGVQGLRDREIAKELVMRYRVRIAKSVCHALSMAVAKGSLAMGEDRVVRRV